jgi:FdhE protein
MNHDKWDTRIRRAKQLAASHPFAAEGLLFYERLTAIQKTLYAQIKKECGVAREYRQARALRQELDLFVLLPRFGPFVAQIERIGPTPLAQMASELLRHDARRWEELLRGFWEVGSSPVGASRAEELFSWIFLQPYAEYLADHSEWERPVGTPSLCPLCGAKPSVGALRPEGDGGKRSLVCSLCATEWEYRRILCPSCGEEDVHKLAVYTAKEFGYVRVEACDSCRVYLKTVDLTKDGHAIPVVDELGTVPLDLWAAEHGYRKLLPNVLGI